MDNSLSLLKTNVGLTTNVKIMVSDNGLYLESIDSRSELSNVNYKKFYFDKNSYYDELIPIFYDGLSNTISYYIKDDNDSDIMFTDFSKQYDDIYYAGCRNITDNKAYTEDFECFSPLYIKKGKLPKAFIIFRIDGPGLINLSKDNFKEEILNNLKPIKVVDLSTLSDIGYWLNKNYSNNKFFPDSPFYMDYRDLEFSYWNGISYKNGGYTKIGYYLDSFLNDENTYSDFEKHIYDGYMQNSIVFPHILNLSFLFDDYPATPTTSREWSLNRYMGFYLDSFDLYKSVNSYILPNLNTDLKITNGNIIISVSNFNPFVDLYENIEYPYIEINGLFYKVEKIAASSENMLGQKIKINNTLYVDGIATVDNYVYKVISDIDFTGLTSSSINNNTISFTGSNTIYLDNQTDLIPDYNLASVWVIEIDNVYHRVISNNDGTYQLFTDYAFESGNNTLSYYVNYPQLEKNVINLIPNVNNKPISFNIYKCNFTDIVDFETSIVNTPFSKYEYEVNTSISKTDEVKMYKSNYDSSNIPAEKDNFIINSTNTNIPCSSEYTANGELFSLTNNNLNTLWKKNTQRVKWGYMGSISSNDYPYLLNNSYLSEQYNKTTNTDSYLPNRLDRNLDYFYSINASTQSYDYYSLNIQDDDPDFFFSIYDYVQDISNYDYFQYFFNKKSIFSDGDFITNTQKYSLFNYSEPNIPNSTLFRGIKFNIYDVSSIVVNQNNINQNVTIQNINAICNNTYYNWKLSILFSKNNSKVDSDGNVYDIDNQLSWVIIKNLDNGTTYYNGDLILYYDILYKNIGTYSYTVNNSNILDSNYWIPYIDNYNLTTPVKSIFWTPNPPTPYLQGDFVYNFGEYYTFVTQSGIDFWYPATYSNGNYVYNNNNVYKYISPVDSDSFINDSTKWQIVTDYTSLVNWKLVELWNVNNTYVTEDLTVYNSILYRKDYDEIDLNSPDISNKWTILYELYPKGNYVPSVGYSYNINNIYYLCIDNPNSDYLDNGIDIYFNYKYKNIFINIYNNDNTLPYISNVDRDYMYNNLYSKLCSTNFINMINNPSYYYNYSNLLRFIIIKDDVKVYDINNIEKLPVYINCETSDLFNTRINSLKISPSTLNSSQIKVNYILNNNNITTYSQLNYYNGSSLANTISRTPNPQLIPNYHGLKNNIFNSLNRYSGPYSPILYKIQLFKSIGIDNIKPVASINISDLNYFGLSYSYFNLKSISPGLSLGFSISSTASAVGPTAVANDIVYNWNSKYSYIGYSMTSSGTTIYMTYNNISFDINNTTLNININIGITTSSFIGTFSGGAYFNTYEGNYVFDTSLTEFGIMKELILSKVNRNQNILKLGNDLKSIYPMIDEFGYTTTDLFIFKSTWDFNFYLECVVPNTNIKEITNNKLK